MQVLAPYFTIGVFFPSLFLASYLLRLDDGVCALDERSSERKGFSGSSSFLCVVVVLFRSKDHESAT